MNQVTRTDLMPGVHFRAVHTDKFKSAYLSVTFMTPLNEETATENALIPYVLRRGSVSHPDMESISAALDELYGGAVVSTVRKKGETQCVGFTASFLDDAFSLNGEPILEPAAQLIGELLLHPLTCSGVFREDYVTGERDNLIARIRSQMNDKREYASMRLKQLMCSDEAYGVDMWGDEAHAKAITPESLWRRYQDLLINAEIEVYYSGSADPLRAKEALSKALSSLPRAEETDELDCEIRIHAGTEPQVFEEAMDVTQGKLSMGFRTGGITVWEDEYPALVMFNAIFGGTSLSKLFMNVREKLSLCYYASSVIDKMKGLMWVSSGIEFDKYHEAKAEILAQLESIRRGEIEDWELEGARRTIMTAYLTTLDSQGRQEDFWIGQSAAGLDTGLKHMANRIEQVTLEQIVEVSRKIELDTIYFLKGRED